MDSQNRNNTGDGPRPPGQGSAGGGQRRRRSRGPGQNRPRNDGPRPEGVPQDGQNRNPGPPRAASSGPRPQPNDNRHRNQQGQSRRRSGRVLTTNQVLVKYDNLLEQHLMTRRKYYEYFNRVDDRQLRRLEKNFFDSIEHLRRFEGNLEPWQREALEKRRTERYRLDLTYSHNRGWNPEEMAQADFRPDENEDPHFKDSQKQAFEEYKEDNEESVGTYEDYLKLKGLT